MIRIALIDDHEVVRHGLVSFLSSVAEFEIIGQGGTVAEALHLAKALPDILLLDMILTDGTGLDAFRQIRNAQPHVRVVFLSSFCEPESVIPALQLGAAGYLLKDIRPADLITALHDIHLGKLQFHPDVSALMVTALNQNEPDLLQQYNITKREAQIIQLIGQGLNNKTVAQQLNISLLTVKTHVSNILEKLQLEDRTQVAIFALRNNLV